MLPLKKFLLSSLGKKYVMGVSGLALIGFLFMHLGGNILLYSPNPDHFNAYGAGLKGMLGPLFYPAEMSLFVLFVVHMAMAIYLHFVDKPKARGAKYAAGQKGKGGGSKWGWASVNMIVTGLVLTFFLVIHLYQIRYQWQFGTIHTTMLDGEEVINLHKYVADLFKSPWMVAFYCGVMGYLMLHVRHGAWSAVQSLGAMKPEWSKAVYALSAIVAVGVAAGFFFFPLWFYFDIASKFQ